MTPDADQLARWIAAVAESRDREAFASLFAHYAPRIKAYMLKGTPDSAAAEELTQEVMLRVWRKAGSYQSARASVTTWVFTIARNARVDALRRHGRPEPEPDDEAWVPAAPESAEKVLEGRRRAERLREALDGLPPEQADVLRRAYFDHLTLREVAQAESLPLGTVKSRVRLAFKHLRAVLGRMTPS